MTKKVSLQLKKWDEAEQRRVELAANFLLKSSRNGIFYQNGMLAYLIPVQHKLGYRTAPLRMN
jgi:hypothetical protein